MSNKTFAQKNAETVSKQTWTYLKEIARLHNIDLTEATSVTIEANVPYLNVTWTSRSNEQ